jgi:hypothetical protein
MLGSELKNAYAWGLESGNGIGVLLSIRGTVHAEKFHMHELTGQFLTRLIII